MTKDQRRRLSIIEDVCKYRKNKEAKLCFADGCEKIQETVISSTRVRREEDGSKTKEQTETGHIVVECKTHKWKELFSTEQLDGIALPPRMTSVNTGAPVSQVV